LTAAFRIRRPFIAYLTPVSTLHLSCARKTALVLACVALAGTPSIALAGTGIATCPVVVSDIQVQSNAPTAGYDPEGVSAGVQPGFVSLTFKNTAPVAATSVVFELDVDGVKTNSFKDVGTFAPGVSIAHAFRTNSGDLDQQLNVSKVAFADGSVWTDSAGIQPAQR
jgi:hypothetical protein